MLTYQSRNLDNIEKLGDYTKAAALKWHDYLVANNIDILIYETIRTEEQQRANVNKGASQTMQSYHIVGQALDFVPIVDGKTDWNGYGRADIKKAIAEAKRLGFEWGGDWRDFVDKPHLQFNHKGYGTDSFGKFVQTSPKENFNQPLFGVIIVNYPSGYGVNIYDAPNGTYKGEVGGQEAYRVYYEKDGYYDIGNSTWIPKEHCTYKPFVLHVNVKKGYGVNVYGAPNGVYKSRVFGGENYIVFAEKDGWYDIGQSTWIKDDYVILSY